VITIRRAEIDGDFEIGHGGIGFAGEAIERGESVVDMIGLGRELAGFFKAFASFIPAAKIHHGHAALIMFVGRLWILIVGRLHTLFGDAQMGAGAVGEFFTGADENLLEFLFGTLEFLLVEEGHGLFVDLHLSLNERINHFDTTALRGRRG
jgi:hypothetical protein